MVTKSLQRKLKRKVIFWIVVTLIISLLIAFLYFNRFSNRTTNIYLLDGLQIPECSKLAKDHEIRKFGYYSICYRENYEQAEWSAYCLTDKQLEKRSNRSDDFRPDKEISTGSAALADYKGSRFDRGHLTPAADMAFNDEAMSESFFMSNMSPQTPNLNRGAWKYLETEVRKWAKTYGKVYVISGPVLDKPYNEYNTIGTNKVVVPECYYKVILVPLYTDDYDRQTPEDANNVAAVGFILPNFNIEGPFWNYITTIDEIENRTGLNFFSKLDDVVEDSIESTYNINLWR